MVKKTGLKKYFILWTYSLFWMLHDFWKVIEMLTPFLIKYNVLLKFRSFKNFYIIVISVK